MDFENTNAAMERYAQAQRERLHSIQKRGSSEAKAKVMALNLKLKKPGLKQLLGNNPLNDEEFEDLEQFFRLSKGHAK